jgi:hypothetical protein
MLSLLLVLQLVALTPDMPAAPPSTGPEAWSRNVFHRNADGTQTLCRAWTGGGPRAMVQIGSGPVQFVSTLTADKTDEPDPASTPEGFIYAFDDRSNVNQWGAYMTIRARRYTAAGVPIGPDFQIDEQPLSLGSAWRPLISVGPSGMVAFAFTAGWDNRGYVRLLFPDGSWATPSLLLSEGVDGDQTDPSCCWLDKTHLFVVWSDHHATGGMRLRTRVLASGVWEGPSSILTPTGSWTDQWWPVCRKGPGAQPWVAWQDLSGVWVKAGTASPQFVGVGILPELAPPYVAFESSGDVWVQKLNSVQPPALVSAVSNGQQHRPYPTLAPDRTLWVGWDGPSEFSGNNTNDAFLRGFRLQ